MALLNTSLAFTSLSSTAANPTRTYSQNYPAGTLVVVAYQNSTKSSTPKLTSVQDNASPANQFTEITTAGSASRGTTSLWYCILTTPVTTSTTLTFTTTGTQASSYAGFAMQSDGLLSYNVNAKASDDTAAAYQTTLTSQSISVATGKNSGYILSLFGFGAGNVDISGVTYYGYNFPGKIASVRVATTTSGTLSTAFANGQTVDGIVLATGDRILVKNQTTASQNGVYVVVASGSPTRATDFDSSTEILRGTIYVSSGTTNTGTWWHSTNTSAITIGTTSINYASRASMSSSVLAFFYDGGTTAASSVGLAYRPVTATGTNDGAKISSEFDHSGYLSISVHFTESEIVAFANNVIEMF
jgi:hypothetical protein